VHSGRCVGFSHDEVHLWYGRDYHTTTYPCSLAPGPGEKNDGGRWYFENGYCLGGEPDFPAFDMEAAQVHYLDRAVGYIDACAGKAEGYNVSPGAPFFLYYAPHIPHWPHVPAPAFQGSTPMGFYGDFVAQLDDAVGQLVAALERNGLREDTLLIFTSDNGPETQCYSYIDRYGHFSMGEWRGVKRDLWEGGHRTPFILSWPGVATAGRVSDRFVSQTDIFATIADYIGHELPANGCEDGFSFLDELLPKRTVPVRRDMAIYHTANNKLALREGDWVFIDDASGDCGNQEPQWFREMRGVQPHKELCELFNLAADPRELQNLSTEHPERVDRMRRTLRAHIAAGRTAPAPSQPGA